MVAVAAALLNMLMMLVMLMRMLMMMMMRKMRLRPLRLGKALQTISSAYESRFRARRVASRPLFAIALWRKWSWSCLGRGTGCGHSQLLRKEGRKLRLFQAQRLQFQCIRQKAASLSIESKHANCFQNVIDLCQAAAPKTKPTSQAQEDSSEQAYS